MVAIALISRTTESRAEHVAVFVAIGTDNTILDGHRSLTGEVGVVVVRDTNGSQVAAAIHVAVDLASPNGGIRVELHPTCRRAELLFLVHIDTAAAAKHIAHRGAFCS